MVTEWRDFKELKKSLKGAGKKEMQAFVLLRNSLMRQLDREDVWRELCKDLGYKPDGEEFLFLRAGILSKGPSFCKSVIADPSVLRRHKNQECEEILYLADEILEDEIDDVGYETGVNAKGWTAAGLEELSEVDGAYVEPFVFCHSEDRRERPEYQSVDDDGVSRIRYPAIGNLMSCEILAGPAIEDKILVDSTLKEMLPATLNILYREKEHDGPSKVYFEHDYYIGFFVEELVVVIEVSSSRLSHLDDDTMVESLTSLAIEALPVLFSLDSV